MNEEITELYRNVEMMIDSKEGFNGNGRDLLRLDFESLSEHIDTREERIEDLEEIAYDYEDEMGNVVYKELAKSKVLFEDEGHLEDVAQLITDKVNELLRKKFDEA